MIRVSNATATPTGSASSNVGTTTIGSPIVTTLDGTWLTNNVKVGYWMSFDKGFADITQPYEVIAVGATSLTLKVNATANTSDATVTPVADMFTNGNGGAYPRTIQDAIDRNTVQEEIANVISSAGIALSSIDNAQLEKAVVIKTGDDMTGSLGILDDLSFSDFDILKAGQEDLVREYKSELTLSGATGFVTDLLDGPGIVNFINIYVSETVTASGGTLTDLGFEIKNLSHGIADITILAGEWFDTPDSITLGSFIQIPLGLAVNSSTLIEFTPVGATSFTAGKLKILSTGWVPSWRNAKA